MATDFFIKTGDTAPAIVAILKDADDEVVDLSGSSVRFIMRDKLTNETVVDAVASVSDADSGEVTYQWVAGDTDTPDTYKAEWEVVLPGGTIETFPNSTYLIVKIVQDLGGVAPA